MEPVSDVIGRIKSKGCQSPEISPTQEICNKRQRILRNLRLQEPLKTFGNFKVKPELAETYQAFRGVVQGDYKFLLCFGGTGSGKSHLLRATVLRLYGKKMLSRYFEWHTIIEALKGGIDKDAVPSYRDILWGYCNAQTLMIDDYGLGGTNTPWEQSQFDVIINYRYDRQLITVVTTNLLPDEIPERAMSRFKDADISRIVVNRAGDYRRLKGAKSNSDKRT